MITMAPDGKELTSTVVITHVNIRCINTNCFFQTQLAISQEFTKCLEMSNIVSKTFKQYIRTEVFLGIFLRRVVSRILIFRSVFTIYFSQVSH